MTDLLGELQDRSTVGVTRCHGGVEERGVTRVFLWVNPISDRSPETRRPRGRMWFEFSSKNFSELRVEDAAVNWVVHGHFEDTQFMNAQQCNKLICNAVPTIFPVPNPPNKIAVKRKLPVKCCRTLSDISHNVTDTVGELYTICDTDKSVFSSPQKLRLTSKIHYANKMLAQARMCLWRMKNRPLVNQCQKPRCISREMCITKLRCLTTVN